MYKDGTVFQPRLLKGVKMPQRVTTREDVELGYVLAQLRRTTWALGVRMCIVRHCLRPGLQGAL